MASEVSVPTGWTLDVLDEHVSDIMFNGAERVEMDCALCRQAAAAGCFDRFDDGDPWLPELKRLASGLLSWRCLTVRPPWSWAMSVEGDEGKGVENRSTNTNWREWVAIHSGRQWSERGAGDPRVNGLWDKHRSIDPEYWEVQPLNVCSVEEKSGLNVIGGSGIIVVARIVDAHRDEGCCRPWGETDYTHADGHQVRRVWHWVLADRRRVDPPLPVPRGYQGLWKPDPDLLAELGRVVA